MTLTHKHKKNAIYEEAMRELDVIAEEQKQTLKTYMDELKESQITKLTKELQG